MSGRNGIAGRRGGRETASAPVSDERAIKAFEHLALALAKAEKKRDEWKARAKLAEARACRLAKDVLRLEKRLNGGKRNYTRGELTAQDKADILARHGFVTAWGKPPTRYWMYRINRFSDDAPSWLTDRDISRADFERKAIEAAAEQRAIPAERRMVTTWRR